VELKSTNLHHDTDRVRLIIFTLPTFTSGKTPRACW